jgi:hypothetical protein
MRPIALAARGWQVSGLEGQPRLQFKPVTWLSLSRKGEND